MKFALLVIAFAFNPAHADIDAAGCFHGWVSQKGKTYPTGNCVQEPKENSPRLSTSIEIDYPSQRIYVHGNLKDANGEIVTWFNKYKVTSCTDMPDGVTVVGAENPNHEVYLFRFKENFAHLSVIYNDEAYNADMECSAPHR